MRTLGAAAKRRKENDPPACDIEGYSGLIMMLLYGSGIVWWVLKWWGN